MNQALYAHMNNKRKKKVLPHIKHDSSSTNYDFLLVFSTEPSHQLFQPVVVLKE
jgi:hypothetical protein